jgi:hypothetical protein
MKPKPPHKGMPAHIYLYEDFDGMVQWSSTQATFKENIKYVRADLYENARARIKALEKELEDINQDLFNRPPIVGGES